MNNAKISALMPSVFGASPCFEMSDGLVQFLDREKFGVFLKFQELAFV